MVSLNFDTPQQASRGTRYLVASLYTKMCLEFKQTGGLLIYPFFDFLQRSGEYFEAKDKETYVLRHRDVDWSMDDQKALFLYCRALDVVVGVVRKFPDGQVTFALQPPGVYAGILALMRTECLDEERNRAPSPDNNNNHGDDQ